jgi:hypothetical protein
VNKSCQCQIFANQDCGTSFSTQARHRPRDLQEIQPFCEVGHKRNQLLDQSADCGKEYEYLVAVIGTKKEASSVLVNMQTAQPQTFDSALLLSSGMNLFMMLFAALYLINQ